MFIIALTQGCSSMAVSQKVVGDNGQVKTKYDKWATCKKFAMYGGGGGALTTLALGEKGDVVAATGAGGAVLGCAAGYLSAALATNSKASNAIQGVGALVAGWYSIQTIAAISGFFGFLAMIVSPG